MAAAYPKTVRREKINRKSFVRSECTTSCSKGDDKLDYKVSTGQFTAKVGNCKPSSEKLLYNFPRFPISSNDNHAFISVGMPQNSLDLIYLLNLYSKFSSTVRGCHHT